MNIFSKVKKVGKTVGKVKTNIYKRENERIEKKTERPATKVFAMGVKRIDGEKPKKFKRIGFKI